MLRVKHIQGHDVSFAYMSIGNWLGNFQTIASGFIFLLLLFENQHKHTS